MPGGRNGFYTHHLLKFLADAKPVRDMLEEVQFEIMEKTQNTQKPWVNAWMGSRRAKRIQLAGLKPRPQPVPPPPRPNPVSPPPRPQPTPPANAALMKAGTRVKVNGLKARPDINGRRGRVVAYSTDRERYHVVILDTEEAIFLRLANVELDDDETVVGSVNSDVEVLRSWRVRDPKLQSKWMGDDPKDWEGVTFDGDSVVNLELDGIELTSVPAEIGQLTSLKKLFLSFNQLTSVPAEIGRLT